MTNVKRALKTACKLFKSLFLSLLICGVVVSLAISTGYVIKASAPAAEVETTAIAETQTERTETRPAFLDLGEFELTAYCPCSECCGKWADGITSTGVTAKAGRTIAVDEDVIPYGSEVIINGHTYVAEDCGGAIIGKRIDVYFDSHSEALEFGRQTANVILKVGDE